MDALPPLEIPQELVKSIIQMVKPMGVSKAQILWDKGDILVVSDSGKTCRLVLNPKLPPSGEAQSLPSITALSCQGNSQ